jgi:MarR family transcriptional regulator, organic hydroperoxide resistance regulator
MEILPTRRPPRLIARSGFDDLHIWRRERRLAIALCECSTPQRTSADVTPFRGNLIPNRNNPERSIRVWFRLVRLEARMQAAVGERLRLIGLSIPQCDVLTTLSEEEGVSQQELAKRLYVTKGNISGLLDRLERVELVERRPAACDRRQYSIHLTEAGRAIALKAIAVQHRWIASTLGHMKEADLEALETQLVALRDIVREAQDPA